MFFTLLAAAVAAQPAVAALQPAPSYSVVAVPVRSDGRTASGIVLNGNAPAMTPVTAIPVHVRVMGGGQELLNETFRVTPSAGANYQLTRSEAPEAVCSGERFYSSQERYAVNLNLYIRDNSSPMTMINVTASWQRPSKTPSCGGEGTRQVQLTQTVPLEPGKSVTIEGDAGLTVTVSR